jgi:hypothetical protein
VNATSKSRAARQHRARPCSRPCLVLNTSRLQTTKHGDNSSAILCNSRGAGILSRVGVGVNISIGIGIGIDIDIDSLHLHWREPLLVVRRHDCVWAVRVWCRKHACCVGYGAL